jgi:iron(III) transport system substrate-binding protein
VIIVGSLADLIMESAKGFKEKYPFITIKGLSLNTVKTVNRVATEVQAGKVTVDMVDTGSDGVATLARLGYLQKPMVEYPHLKDFLAPDRMQPASGLFVNHLMIPRVQGVYNTEMVSPEELPTSWEEMADPRWKGRVMISASAEEQPGRFAYLWRKDGELNWERSFDFWRKIKAQDPLVTKGFRRGAEQVAAGEKAIFWLSVTGPPTRQHFDGAPVGIIAFPTFPANFRTDGIIKGAPHPAAAWLLIDYLTSPEGQFLYTDIIDGNLLMNQKAKPGKLTQFMMEQGATVDNTEASASDYTFDAMAAVCYDPENQKKSEDFFLELMGVR